MLRCTRQVLPTLANAQRKHHRLPKRKAGFSHRTEARRDLSPDCQVPPSGRFCQRDMSYLGNADKLASSWGAQVLLGQKLVPTANLTPTAGLGLELSYPVRVLRAAGVCLHKLQVAQARWSHAAEPEQGLSSEWLLTEQTLEGCGK